MPAKQPPVMAQLAPLISASLHLIPIQARLKVPILADWVNTATDDPSTILRWALIHPNCNWGLVTGVGSGVFVVDIDKKANGDKSWDHLLKANDGKLPDTVRVRTGGGGQHIYFKYPKHRDIRNSAGKLGRGIDIRGEGGQVLVPPSLHPSGGAYEWEEGHGVDDVEFAAAPRWLLDLAGAAAGDEDGAEGVMGEPLRPGERNNQMYTQALKLARQGALQELAVAAMVTWQKAQRGGEVPLDEIQATVASAYKAHEGEAAKRTALDGVEMSDAGNAARLVTHAGDRLSYVSSLGWHVWQGSHWGRDPENLAVTAQAMDAMDSFRDEVIDELQRVTDRTVQAKLFRLVQWALQSRNTSRLSSMASLARSLPGIAVDRTEMDAQPTDFLLNCANGVLDLRTGELTPHDPALRIARVCPTRYVKSAKCPTWLETLRLAFHGDRELTSYLQRAIGYSLSASTSETAFFILWGPEGRNGKSTIMETVGRVLGEGYAMMSDGRVISAGSSGDNYILSSLAALVGVRLVSMNELSDTAVLEENLIKQITGGDTIQAKMLYMEPFRYVPAFKIFMRTNNKPIIRGTNEAIWRRVKCIPFLHSIPPERVRPRHEVDSALAAESEGILAWAVRGFRDWHDNGGLRDPEEVRLVVQEYRESSDVVAQFFDEAVVVDDGAETPRKSMYSAFRQWYEDQGMRYCMTAEKFARRVADRLDQHNDRVRRGGRGHVVAVWRGVRLNPEVVSGVSMFLE